MFYLYIPINKELNLFPEKLRQRFMSDHIGTSPQYWVLG